MSCGRMENKILAYVDGRMKEGERRETEKHLASCPACQLRVSEFRAVNSLLDELPQIEPSAAFDLRVRALVAAEPVKRSWWAGWAPAPRIALAASLLLLAMVWIGSHPSDSSLSANEIEKIDQNMPVLENYDVLSEFTPLTDLPQPVQQEDDSTATDSGNQTQPM